MEKKNIPKKDSNGKKDSQLRKEAMHAIKTKQLINLALVLVFIIIFGAGIAIVYLNTTTINIDDSTPGFIKKMVELNDRLMHKKVTPAAVVNGEEISMQELDDRYNLLPNDYKTLVAKNDVLSQMIDEKILLQQANKLNITVSNEEVDERIQMLLEENQITQEQFEAAIAGKNITIESVREFYAKETILTKLLNYEVISKIKVSERDIENYYDDNPDLFKIPASVNVSHILMCHNDSLRCTSNSTKEESLEKSKKIREMINSTNFAEMALNYSDEPAAKITQGNLGWISMESPFDLTFMNATFALAAGNVSDPVETVFGYHLIKVFEKREEDIINLTAVYEQVNQTIALEKEKDEFGVYLSQIKNESEITNYLKKKE